MQVALLGTNQTMQRNTRPPLYCGMQQAMESDVEQPALPGVPKPQAGPAYEFVALVQPLQSFAPDANKMPAEYQRD